MGLDSVELLIAIEEDFRIEISNEESEKIITVGDSYRIVCAKLGEGCNKDEVWKKLCDIIVKQLGVSRDKITPEASFVDDLGVD